MQSIRDFFNRLFGGFSSSDRRRLSITSYHEYNLSSLAGTANAITALNDPSAEDATHVSERTVALDILHKLHSLHVSIAHAHTLRERMHAEMEERQAHYEHQRRLVQQRDRRALSEIGSPSTSCIRSHEPVKLSGGTIALSLPFQATVEVNLPTSFSQKEDISMDLLEEFGVRPRKIPIKLTKTFPIPIPLLSVKLGFSLDVKIPIELHYICLLYTSPSPRDS